MSKLNNALSMLDILSARSVVSVQELSDALEISTRAVDIILRQSWDQEVDTASYQVLRFNH